MRKTLLGKSLVGYVALSASALALMILVTTIAMRVMPGPDERFCRIVLTIAAGGLLLIACATFFLRRHAGLVNEPIDSIKTANELHGGLAAIGTQRNQLETVLSSMVEGVIVLDDTRRIVSMNEAAADLLGVSPDEGSGKSLLQYVRNAELDELAEAARTICGPVERTITLYREQTIYLQVHATRIHSDSESLPDGILLVMNNISRIKQLETVRTDFVANVSHELKTPVTSIKGFVETLLDDSSISPEQSKRFLNIVLKHTNRLNNILEDLLSLSRLEQPDQQIEFSRCSSEEIVDTALEICRSKAAAKDIVISREFRGSTTIRANPSLLEQAVLNLVDNAIKYSDNGSEVAVEVTNGLGELSISVKDHGQGIRSQNLPRVFERFYRTDKARSRELGGTGLGLAIMKHIARLHRGEVTVESTLGEGSTFTMSLPQANSGKDGAGDDPG